MKRLLAVFVAAAVLCASAAEKSATARLDLTSVPDGASVSVDGVARGVTPLMLLDLDAEVPHHVVFSMSGYEDAEAFVRPGEAGYLQRHAELTPVKGLLLVTTEPKGAELSISGYSLGETPRLVTTLDAKNSYKIVVRKPGYQERRLDVRFDGRRPLVHHVNLVLDSGVLDVTSSPSGAEVTVNGTVRGTTPLTVEGIPKGRIVVSFAKEGYRPLSKEVFVSVGAPQKLDVALEPIPASLKLTSVPEGARFYIDGVAQGMAPLVAESLAPGTHVVRAEKDGCAPLERTVLVSNGQVASEEFRLESVLGRVEVKTMPTGATVLIDGKSRGRTSGGAADGYSDVFTVQDVKAGEHTLVINLDGYREIVKNIYVEPKKAVQFAFRLTRYLKPNVRITTATGVIGGVLKESGDPNSTYFNVEEKLGVIRAVPRDQVRKIDYLTD